MSSIMPARGERRLFIGGCTAIVLAQALNAGGIIWTLQRIAGHVVPPDAAEAYAAGYAVGAVRGERRQDDRRTARRGRSADRARWRREGNGHGNGDDR